MNLFIKIKKVKLYLEIHLFFQLNQELFSTLMHCFCWAKRENLRNKTSRIKLKDDVYYDL